MSDHTSSSECAVALRPGSAFTLMELVVVLGIVGVLAALLLSAIHRIREAANRTTCTNALRHIALALQQYHATYYLLPSNGAPDGTQTILSADGKAYKVFTTDLAVGRTFYWGVGDPGRPPDRQPGSWLYSILPYVEQDSIFRQRAWTYPVGLYICPSRRGALSYSVVSRDAYGVYGGGGWTWGKTDYAANALIIAGLVRQRPRNLRLGQIADGTSNTIAAGEKAIDPDVQTATTWYWDEPFFLGGSGSTARSGVGVMLDRKGNSYKRNWGSAHAEGSHFALCDGSVRLIKYGISWEVMAAYLSPSGGEVNMNEF